MSAAALNPTLTDEQTDAIVGEQQASVSTLVLALLRNLQHSIDALAERVEAIETELEG